MATLDMYIGSDGDTLIPIDNEEFPTLISKNGKYYFAQTSEVVTIVAGNPYGPWIWMTYPAAP